ncbi:MAG: sulfotransferase [Parasphingorhabdus sp.]|uniref:sulfotransferase family protein n=1 Tax=Parasphingorhabdus sp. TaxID=2709688 RepID=UPI00300113C2
MTGTFDFVPLIIIGAGRSGTNILRDSLCKVDGLVTWDCDEINPLWRHGNINWPNDEIPPERANAGIKEKIRSGFQKIAANKPDTRFVVEKTCANSLRVDYVHEILPEARYIQIVRDGVDVIASASKRWKGELEVEALPYYLAKLRYTPWQDIPHYAARFLKNRWMILSGQQDRFEVWGPRYRDMQQDGNLPLIEICAKQWAACVDRSDTAFTAMDESRYLRIHYEQLATSPAAVFRKIFTFLNTPVTDTMMEHIISDVRVFSIGKGHRVLQGADEVIGPHINSALLRHGYSPLQNTGK